MRKKANLGKQHSFRLLEEDDKKFNEWLKQNPNVPEAIQLRMLISEMLKKFAKE